jgi:creatinine amidohydrolase
MGRNGCQKVIIVNAHGGNEYLLPYFAQTQLDTPHDYVLYVQWGHERGKKEDPESKGPDWHAGETETSRVLVTRPDLVHMERANNESGADQRRVKLPENVYTGMWWYTRFPNHYSGDGSLATKELGEADIQNWVNAVVRAIRAVKADDESLKLQKEFFEKSRHPMDTEH